MQDIDPPASSRIRWSRSARRWWSEVAKREGRRAATRQLLAFSRQQVLAPRIVDLNGVVANSEKLLRRVIGEDLVLDVIVSSDLWTIRADPGQVEQVLMNLCINNLHPDQGT